MADPLRGAGPLAQQFHELAVQFIDAYPQFFDRHFDPRVSLQPSALSLQLELAE